MATLEDPNRTPAWGWFVSAKQSSRSVSRLTEQKACPMDSPANIRPGSENATHEILRELVSPVDRYFSLLLAKSFIFDHLPTMDFCDFPELKRLHGSMQYVLVSRYHLMRPADTSASTRLSVRLPISNRHLCSPNSPPTLLSRPRQ